MSSKSYLAILSETARGLYVQWIYKATIEGHESRGNVYF